MTDDNPRTEDAAAIRAAVRAGAPEATEIGDRAEAILTAVDALQPGDALLIAGKGHETGQIVGQDVLPFDDIEQASVAVAALDGLGRMRRSRARWRGGGARVRRAARVGVGRRKIAGRRLMKRLLHQGAFSIVGM